MRIEAKLVKAKELKEGDLFSTADELYWSVGRSREDGRVGEKVYIRTECPCPKDQEEDPIYKLTIITNEKDNKKEKGQ